jgi:transposase
MSPGFYIMMDNLPVHRTTAVKEVIQAAGHMQLFRPAYSPDLAPIECAFSKIKTHLRSRRYDINEDNLLHFIEEAIRSITVEDCKNWFKNCGYSL